VALGFLTFDDIPARVQIAHTYQPNPAHHQIYDELFQEFLNIYKCNRKIYARLNKGSDESQVTSEKNSRQSTAKRQE
jgi:xylulokinase